MAVPAAALKAFGSFASLMSFRVLPLPLGVVPTPPLRAWGEPLVEMLAPQDENRRAAG